MVRMSMRRPATVATATAGVLAAALVSVTSPGATAKPPHHQPTSTPVPIATPDGVVSSYLLNARTTNANQVHRVERAVTEAGGTVVQTWPQIGVVVAHSTSSTFRDDVKDEDIGGIIGKEGKVLV